MEIRTIVVGIDFSPQSEAAAVEAVGIARRVGAKLVLIHVGELPPEGGVPDNSAAAEWERALRQQASDDMRALESLVTRLSSSGVDISHRVVDGHPDDGVCEAALELGAELVVTGSHGRTGIKRFLLGSVAERIVRVSHTSVLVARGNYDPTAGYRRILVPTDFSRHAEHSLALALELVADGGEVELVHYYQLPMISGGYAAKIASQTASALTAALQAEAEAEGAKLVERYKTPRANLRFVAVRDNVMHGVIERAGAAKPPYDLIAVGSHGHRGFRRLILGSVAETTMRHAECSVLIVHTP